MRTGGVLAVTGAAAPLADVHSPLKVGRRGTLGGEPAHVLGRTQFDYGDGRWEQWTVRLDDGRTVWVQEDEGELTLLDQQTQGEGPLPAMRMGGQVAVLGQTLFVQEIGEAIVHGVRGEVDLAWTPRRALHYAAGFVGERQGIALFSEGAVVLATGRAIGIGDVSFGVGQHGAAQ